MDIGANSSCNLPVSLGPTWAQSCIYHFYLIMECFCACLTLWLGASDNNQIIMGSSDCIITWRPIVRPVWCLLEGKGDQGICGLNYGIGQRVDIPLRKDSEGVLLALLAESKLLLMVCTSRLWEKDICQISRYISGTRRSVYLLKQWSYIRNSSYNYCQYLIKFTIIDCHSLRSIWFLYRPNWQVEWDVVGITTSASFKSLMVVIFLH